MGFDEKDLTEVCGDWHFLVVNSLWDLRLISRTQSNVAFIECTDMRFRSAWNQLRNQYLDEIPKGV